MRKKHITEIKNQKTADILNAAAEWIAEPALDYLVGYIAALERENDMLKRRVDNAGA
jgi:hypothetical protein